MAWIWTWNGVADSAVNLAPATGDIAIYTLKEALKQAGWVVKDSSDGVTAWPAGAGIDIIVSGLAGAGGLGNTNAWFRIQSPAGAGGREFTFQRGGGGSRFWRIKLSHSAGFTGGAPGTLVTPSATDEAIVCGGGTDAGPSFFLFPPADGSYKLHIGTDNAAPYDAFALFIPNGGGGLTRCWWHINLVAGSYPAEDVAPYLVDARAPPPSSALASSIMTPYTTPTEQGFGQGWFKKGLSGERFVAFGAGLYESVGGQVPPSMVINPYDGDSNPLPIPIARVSSSAEPGWKGFAPTGTILWKTDPKSDGDYDDIGGARYAYFASIAIRWPTTVIPVL